MPLSMGIIRGIEVRSGRMHLIKDASNKSFTDFDHFNSLSFCFEIISIGLFLEILKNICYRHFCVICFWLVFLSSLYQLRVLPSQNDIFVTTAYKTFVPHRTSLLEAK